jgi:hypothetical protein
MSPVAPFSSSPGEAQHHEELNKNWRFRGTTPWQIPYPFVFTRRSRPYATRPI